MLRWLGWVVVGRAILGPVCLGAAMGAAPRAGSPPLHLAALSGVVPIVLLWPYLASRVPRIERSLLLSMAVWAGLVALLTLLAYYHHEKHMLPYAVASGLASFGALSLPRLLDRRLRPGAFESGWSSAALPFVSSWVLWFLASGSHIVMLLSVPFAFVSLQLGAALGAVAVLAAVSSPALPFFARVRLGWRRLAPADRRRLSPVVLCVASWVVFFSWSAGRAVVHPFAWLSPDFWTRFVFVGALGWLAAEVLARRIAVREV